MMQQRLCLSFLTFLLSLISQSGHAQNAVNVKGIVFDTDSINAMPFVYSLNKNTYLGTMTDASGRFELSAKTTDTLIFNYLGYEVRRIWMGTYKDSVKNGVLNVKVVLVKKPYNLQQVIILSKEFTKEEKQYYTEKIDMYERLRSQGISSPITGLYMKFSHEGKSIQKLIAMYDELLYEELLEKRLSDDKLRQLTADDTLDCKAFRSYCRLSENFLRLASEYDLYVAVAKLYPDYKAGKKPYRKVK
ncbi:MAG: carboxypeptidase-like regulatory domain-containing protein [Bacteroidia bacterium]